MSTIKRNIPAVGDTVKALTVEAIPHAEGRLATVVRHEHHNGEDYLSCSFDSYTDSDNVYRPSTDWMVREWAAVGDRVIARDIPMFDGYEGKIATITSFHPNGDIAGEFQSIQKPDDSINLSFRQIEDVIAIEDTDIIEPKMIPVSDHDREVEVLQNRIRNLERELATGKETHADLGRRLLDQAENRGWCSEFDEFVSDYNGDCPSGWEIDERVKLVQKRVRVTGTVYRDITVWVKEDDDVTDPDNWYSDNDPDTAVDSDYVTEQLDSEYEGNGWDDTNVRSI